MNHTLLEIFDQFFPDNSNELHEIVPLQTGLINETYRVTLTNGSNYILQRINTEIFKNPQALQENCTLISDFLTKNALSETSSPQLILTPIPTRDGKLFFQVDENAWRMFPFFDQTDCFDVVASPEHAFHAAKALANFHSALSGFDPKQLFDPIPNFLNFTMRLDQYERAKHAAKEKRIVLATQEIEWINSLLPRLQKHIEIIDQLPKRVIHADPKISNFLFNENTTTVAGIIDWDTIMLGSILYDVGDMVRSFTNRKREDDDSSKPAFDATIFDAILSGYAEESTHLSDAERENLILGARTVVAIQAIRFLTDYLNEDVYYAVIDAQQNLRRARNQLQLLKELESHPQCAVHRK